MARFTRKPELSPVKVILAILLLDCCVNCANLPRQEFPGNDMLISAAPRRGFRQEAVPRRSIMSDLQVISSEVNGTGTEAQILLEFRKGVTRDPLNILSAWNSRNISNYCRWPGVNCSSSGSIGQVIGALNLSGLQLEGSISPLLGGLQFLESLDLSHNFFEGTIPTSVGNCSGLTVVDLSNNSVWGGIPTELASLSNLEVLNLYSNALTGVLPPALSNLSALRVLNLGNNQIHGDMTSVAWGGFGRLEWLSLENNQISGVIPDSLSNCSSLVGLNFTMNHFTGDIRSLAWDSFVHLQTLELRRNWITGAIPESLSNCSSLVELSLTSNNLTGNIPGEFGKLPKLQILGLANNSLEGSVPEALLNCSTLTGLHLAQNWLTGAIPAAIGVLSRLDTLNICENRLTGSLPLSLANCTLLSGVTFSENFLGGEIPPALGTLRKLKTLQLDVNNFEGGIPSTLGNSSSILSGLVLSGNRLNGRIPSQLGLLKSLEDLDLSSNFLTGQIPHSLGNSTSLISLILPRNRLGGSIPSSIGELTRLQGLILSHNLLTGGVPAELCNCTKLYILDLSANRLTQCIPDKIGTLPTLSRLYLNNNNFSGNLSSTIKQVSTNIIDISVAHNSLSGVIAGYDFRPLQSLQLSLDLSHNMFSGPLPPGIGVLEFAQNINLSFNAFSGAITDVFSQCRGLESLDLSSNNLDGEIPPSLATVQLLTSFNVSFNRLTGAVPDTGPFADFSYESFLGNPHLCGPMLSNKCGRSSCSLTCRRHRLLIIIIPVVAAGVITPLIVGVIWFLSMRKTQDSSGKIAPALSSASHSKGLEDSSLGYVVEAISGAQKKFSESILRQTIDDFSGDNVIGRGARSVVYKGVLPGGESFALKRLLPNNDRDGTERGGALEDLGMKKRYELVKEAETLAKFRHKNILKILGFYSGLDHKALILEYMCGGSLHRHLYEIEPCQMTWETRLKVALGVAQGMKYLHHDFPEPVIHRDLKPSNILLDEDFEPKVGDFDISKFVDSQRGDGEASASTFCGTIGYLPPEYASQPWISTKGDVYSYGMVLMELLTRRQPCSPAVIEDEGSNLRKWVLLHFDDRPRELLDPSLTTECGRDAIAMEQMMQLLKVSLFCTRSEPQRRPSMINVVEMLTNIVDLGAKPVIRRKVEEIANDASYQTMMLDVECASAECNS